MTRTSQDPTDETAGAEPLIVRGFELLPIDADATRWRYRPRRPSLERKRDGTPMLQVIEAGGTAFLQATARVALDERERAELFDALKRERPAANSLEPLPLDVRRVVLEIGRDDGWSVLAESRGSGSAPWTAALAAMLDPAAVTALKAAMGGETGRARLVAYAVEPGSHAQTRCATATIDLKTRTSAGLESLAASIDIDRSTPATADRPLELSVDLADLFSSTDVRDR
ncbi:MAG: hypothetical protein QM766_09105 [Burkholderiaceae bacterium]